MTKEISFRPAHFQSFHKGSENAVIESERLPGRVSFATIFLPKGGGDLFFTAAPPHEASFGRVCRKKYFVRSSPQRSRSLQTRRLRNIRPTAQRWMRGLRPICGPVSQRLISPAGRIRPAPGSCRARALLSLYVCHAAVIWQRQPSCCCGTGPGCPPPPVRWPEPPAGWR